MLIHGQDSELPMGPADVEHREHSQQVWDHRGLESKQDVYTVLQ